MIVDRTIGGAYENYVTPERKIPEQPPVKVWESNIPLTKNWGYWPNDEYKEGAEVILSFVQIVAKGGNLLLGIGPKPNGELPTEAVAILERLGDWLEKYGEGIYETRAVPFDSPEGWYVTQKNGDYYFFYKENASSLLLSEVGLDYRNFTIQELSEKNQVMGSETLVPGKTIEGIGCWQLMAE